MLDCCAVLCCVVLCCAVLCCAVLCQLWSICMLFVAPSKHTRVKCMFNFCDVSVGCTVATMVVTYIHVRLFSLRLQVQQHDKDTSKQTHVFVCAGSGLDIKVVRAITAELRKQLGLTLFGYDTVVQENTGSLPHKRLRQLLYKRCLLSFSRLLTRLGCISIANDCS